MGWHHWLMKHGIGSPGHIARRMARHYRLAKEARPYWSEREVLNAVYAMRVAAQSILGGPVEYRMTKEDFSLKTAVLDENPDLFSIIRYAVMVEHPELQNPYAPPDRFENSGQRYFRDSRSGDTWLAGCCKEKYPFAGAHVSLYGLSAEVQSQRGGVVPSRHYLLRRWPLERHDRVTLASCTASLAAFRVRS